MEGLISSEYKGEKRTPPISVMVEDGGGLVKSLRLRLGLSSEELGSKLGLTGRLVRYWEKGDRGVYLKDIKNIVALLPDDTEFSLIRAKVKSLTAQETSISQGLTELKQLVTNQPKPQTT